MRLVVGLLLVLVVIQPRLEALGPLPVGPAVHLHLEDAQIHPQLDLVAAVVARDDPHQHRVGSNCHSFRICEKSFDMPALYGRGEGGRGKRSRRGKRGQGEDGN